MMNSLLDPEDMPTSNLVADVVIDVAAQDIEPVYTYRLGDGCEAFHPGDCVVAPFGNSERLGYVAAIRKAVPTDAANLKAIALAPEGAPSIPPEQLKLAQWMTTRWCCDLASALRLVSPSAFSASLETIAILAPREAWRTSSLSEPQEKLVRILIGKKGAAPVESLRHASRLSAFNTVYPSLKRGGIVTETRRVKLPRLARRTVTVYDLADSEQDEQAVSKAGLRILNTLQDWREEGLTPAPGRTLVEAAECSVAALRTLVKSGHVLQEELALRRVAVPQAAGRTFPPKLTLGQRAAVAWIAQSTEERPASKPSDKRALLFGVTASGKSEVYLNAIRHVLAQGKSSIALVPEIALSHQLVEVFSSRFGDEVAILHSALAEGERFDEWQRIREGKAKIIVGARSAVFAPAPNLGLIIIDEEHESSYKQDTYPRYDARVVAAQRAKESGATLVLGSATPSLESFHAAERGDLTLLRMPDRIDNRPLPQVHLVDMRDSFKERKSLFSDPLEEALRETLSQGRQAILMLNRRGFHRFVLCRDCGYVARCEHCAVSLAFHAASKELRCHHCNAARPLPQACPECHGAQIKGFGIGTERVQMEAQELFPEARIVRLDRDTTGRKGAHSEILRRFRHGEANLLIGTQMVAKGLDFPGVTLVGAISADTTLNVPDFRAAERTFQLVTQVAGRAGRGENPGQVYVQSFDPEHASLTSAAVHDYESFYRSEIQFRRELNYPPFARLANIICTDTEDLTAARLAAEIASAVKQVGEDQIEVMGPSPAPLARLRGEFRWHVVIKGAVNSELETIVARSLKQLTPSKRENCSVDIDPMSLA